VGIRTAGVLLLGALIGVDRASAPLFAQVSGVIYGVVVDAASGAPIGGARLRILAESPESSAEVTIASGVAAGGGDFTLTFESPANVSTAGILEASAPGYAVERLRWPRPDPSSALSIELTATVAVRIELRDAFGVHVPGRVQLETLRPGNVVAAAMTTDTGVLELAAPPGFLSVVALADGFAPAVSRLMVDSGPPSLMDITLSRSATVEGLVTDESGNPLEGATVVGSYDSREVAGSELAGYLGGRLITRGDGLFVLLHVVPGISLRVEAVVDGRRSDVREIRATPGDRVTGLTLVIRD